MIEPAAGEAAWQDALAAALLLAIDPLTLGGAVLRARSGPVRDDWLASFRDLLDRDTPWRKIPHNVSESRLIGGLDLPATLKAGTPIIQTGLLSECDGGISLLAMAERAGRGTVAQLCRALDTGEVLLEREGLRARQPARITVIALDEGASEEEQVAAALKDRLAFSLDLNGVGIRDLSAPGASRMEIASAAARLPGVHCDEQSITALCATGLMLGVDSPRINRLALAAACAGAALADRDLVDQPDLELAVRLVLAPRATRLPAPPPEEEANDNEPPPPPEPGDAQDSDSGESRESLEDRLIEAAAAAIPRDLLARLLEQKVGRGSTASGKSGAAVKSRMRGRPMGTAPGDPRRGARLSPVATLRAAAPWQGLRQREAEREGRESAGMFIERDDFRVVRFRDRSESTTLFVVDASGSAALNRLAEAKGAIELLLADCYIRRDQVAMIAFRGDAAELLLPPTRSLVRAKRNLAALPGGGGTPLASAVELAAAVGEAIRQRGGTPAVVFLTDGRANIGRDGSRGRVAAAADLETATGQYRSLGLRSMVIDTSPRPHASAEALARALGALYLPLPHADASRLRDAVQAATA